MWLDQERFRHDFAGEDLSSLNVGQLVASSETSLDQQKQVKEQRIDCTQTLPRNLPLAYCVRVRGSKIILGMLNSSWVALILLFG
jgi:hypothetical protein